MKYVLYILDCSETTGLNNVSPLSNVQYIDTSVNIIQIFFQLRTVHSIPFGHFL